MQIDISPLSAMEVVRGTDFLTKRRAAWPDRQFPGLEKNGCKVSTSKLTKLPTREEIPKDWCNSVIASIYEKSDRS